MKILINSVLYIILFFSQFNSSFGNDRDCREEILAGITQESIEPVDISKFDRIDRVRLKSTKLWFEDQTEHFRERLVADLKGNDGLFSPSIFDEALSAIDFKNKNALEFLKKFGFKLRSEGSNDIFYNTNTGTQIVLEQGGWDSILRDFSDLEKASIKKVIKEGGEVRLGDSGEVILKEGHEISIEVPVDTSTFKRIDRVRLKKARMWFKDEPEAYREKLVANLKDNDGVFSPEIFDDVLSKIDFKNKNALEFLSHFGFKIKRENSNDVFYNPHSGTRVVLEEGGWGLSLRDFSDLEKSSIKTVIKNGGELRLNESGDVVVKDTVKIVEEAPVDKSQFERADRVKLKKTRIWYKDQSESFRERLVADLKANDGVFSPAIFDDALETIDFKNKNALEFLKNFGFKLKTEDSNDIFFNPETGTAIILEQGGWGSSLRDFSDVEKTSIKNTIKEGGELRLSESGEVTINESVATNYKVPVDTSTFDRKDRAILKKMKNWFEDEPEDFRERLVVDLKTNDGVFSPAVFDEALNAIDFKNKNALEFLTRFGFKTKSEDGKDVFHNTKTGTKIIIKQGLWDFSLRSFTDGEKALIKKTVKEGGDLNL